MKVAKFTALALAATTMALVAHPTSARAGSSDVAAGLLGGFALGAIVGATVAPPVVVAPAPVMVVPPPPPPACYWTRGQAYWDGYRWVRPRVQVCN
jgi:hypothetical protein